MKSQLFIAGGARVELAVAVTLPSALSPSDQKIGRCIGCLDNKKVKHQDAP